MGLSRVSQEKPEVWIFMRNLLIFKGWHLIQVLLKQCTGHKKKKPDLLGSEGSHGPPVGTPRSAQDSRLSDGGPDTPTFPCGA